MVDVGLFGIPIEATAVVRGGARAGPAAVREASRVIKRVNPTTKIAPFTLASVADLGDVPELTPFDVIKSVDAATAFVKHLRAAGVFPIAVGGDHTTALPMIRALGAIEALSIIQFDSHADDIDEFYGSRLNNATLMRRVVEEDLVDPQRVVQVGLRGTQFGHDDASWGVSIGFTTVTYDEYEAQGRQKVIDTIKEVVRGGPVYITFDLDALDPSEAPAVGLPEPGGLSVRDAQMILRGLTGLDIVGGDVSELFPAHDPSGITAIVAANILFEMLCLVSVAFDQSRQEPR
jgi:guanidinopropionase